MWGAWHPGRICIQTLLGTAFSFMMSTKPVSLAAHRAGYCSFFLQVELYGQVLNAFSCSQGIGEMLSVYVKATTGWQNKLTYVQAQGSMVFRDRQWPTYVPHALGAPMSLVSSTQAKFSSALSVQVTFMKIRPCCPLCECSTRHNVAPQPRSGMCGPYDGNSANDPTVRTTLNTNWNITGSASSFISCMPS
jgi:hypothetical protein